MLHQMIVPITLRIATAAASVGRVGHLLAMCRHARLLAVLLLQLLLRRLSVMLQHYRTHCIRCVG